MRWGFLAMAALFSAGCVGAEGMPQDEHVAEKNQAFFDAAARENGSIQPEMGVVVRTIRGGNGASPTAADSVKVHYTGRLYDGSTFDSSIGRGPAVFPLKAVIRCWTEGLQHMREGETAMLTCAPETAYGSGGMGKTIPGGSVLQFEVELLAVNPAP